MGCQVLDNNWCLLYSVSHCRYIVANDPIRVTNVCSGLQVPTANHLSTSYPPQALCPTGLIRGSTWVTPSANISPHLQPAIRKQTSKEQLHYVPGDFHLPISTVCLKMAPCCLRKRPGNRGYHSAFLSRRDLLPWRWKWTFPAKRHYISIILHGVTSRRTVTFNKTRSRIESLDVRGQN
jgi:hypothetical protein